MGLGAFQVMDDSFPAPQSVIISEIGENDQVPIAELAVYPNPVNDYITIAIPGEGDANVEMEVLDTNGRILMSKMLPTGQTSTLNINGLKSGVYIIRINYHEKQVSQRIIKE